MQWHILITCHLSHIGQTGQHLEHRTYKIHQLQQHPICLCTTHPSQQTWIQTYEHHHALTPPSAQKKMNEFIRKLLYSAVSMTQHYHQQTISERWNPLFWSRVWYTTLTHRCMARFHLLPSDVWIQYTDQQTNQHLITYWQLSSSKYYICSLFIYWYFKYLLHTHISYISG